MALFYPNTTDLQTIEIPEKKTIQKWPLGVL